MSNPHHRNPSSKNKYNNSNNNNPPPQNRRINDPFDLDQSEGQPPMRRRNIRSSSQQDYETPISHSTLIWSSLFWNLLLTGFVIAIGIISLMNINEEFILINPFHESVSPIIGAYSGPSPFKDGGKSPNNINGKEPSPSEPPSRKLIQALEETQLYISACTDQVPNPGQVEFKGRVIVSYNCPEPRNRCELRPCNSTSGKCYSSVISGGQCAFDEDCGVGGACDLASCQCQSLPNSTVGCIVSSQCPDISDRGICAAYECSPDGVCVETILGQGVCWGDSQCDSATEYCDQSICNCVDRPVQQCTVTDDCLDVSDRGPCSTVMCQSGRCTEVTLGECWYGGQCGGMNATCDTSTCTCVSSSADQCFVDTDCPDVSDRGVCSGYQCVNNTCVETILMGGECWFSDQCGPNNACNQTDCTCVPAPLNQCQQSSDCPDISDRGPCVEYNCVSGVCIETILGEGGCWFDNQCLTDGDTCDLSTCSCEPTPEPSCSFDFECPNITDRGSCVEYQCINNRCVETILGLGECWYSDQCIGGFSCSQSTCGCIPLSGTCSSGYDIRPLPDPATGFSLSCGYGVTISGDFISYVCADASGGSSSFIIETYRRFDDEWVNIDETVTPVSSASLPPSLFAAGIDSYDDIVVFGGKDTVGAQPQSATMIIYQILGSNQLSQLQSVILPSTSELVVDVCIYEDTIVAISNNALIYVRTGPSTWSLNQTINSTMTSPFIKCSIWDDGLVLSYDRSPTGDSYESYVYDGTSWMNIDTGTTASVDGSWCSVVVDVNGEDSMSSFPFMVFSAPLEIPIALLDINSGTGVSVQTSSYVSSNGPGCPINSYDRNVLTSDSLMLNSKLDVTNFQDRFSGFIVVNNDLWMEDVVFVVDLIDNFTTYANFCP